MKKHAFVLATAFALGLPAFAFTAKMELPEVKQEVATRYGQGQSLEVISSAAKAVNIAASVLAPELLATGNTAPVVLQAMIKAGYFPSDAVDALVAQGVDPGALLEATAAGAGFNGASFNSSPLNTSAGVATSSSVSPS